MTRARVLPWLRPSNRAPRTPADRGRLPECRASGRPLAARERPPRSRTPPSCLRAAAVEPWLSALAAQWGRRVADAVKRRAACDHEPRRNTAHVAGQDGSYGSSGTPRPRAERARPPVIARRSVKNPRSTASAVSWGRISTSVELVRRAHPDWRLPPRRVSVSGRSTGHAAGFSR